MRSSWKYKPYDIKPDSMKEIYHSITKHKISSDTLNLRVSVYSGKKLESIIVRPYMIGEKFSNFVSCRYSGKNIHIKKKKRKNK